MRTARFGCPVWAYQEYDSALTLESFFGGFGDTSFAVEPFVVDRVVGETTDGEPLRLAGFGIEVTHVPGHSPDSVCFVLREEGVVRWIGFSIHLLEDVCSEGAT